MEKVSFSTDRGRLYAMIKCELDHHSAREVREAIDRRLFLERPRSLFLDFSEVGFMDSSGLALILGRAEAAGAVGCLVYLIGMSAGILRLITLSGVDRVANITVLPKEV